MELAFGFIFVLFWLFICFLCCWRRPPSPPTDAEDLHSVSTVDLPPTPPQPPRLHHPYAPPPQPPHNAESSRTLAYDFRGIVYESDVLKINNDIAQLDLHGLKVWEATKVTKLFLQQSRGHFRRVRIITGRGLHSSGGIPKIKPQVELLLRGYRYHEEGMGGCFLVHL